ncbi:hypothetical protein BDV19DRAFT_358520 [Aspergillus venezuelensis]
MDKWWVGIVAFLFWMHSYLAFGSFHYLRLFRKVIPVHRAGCMLYIYYHIYGITRWL